MSMKKINWREVLKFLAGAQTGHVLSHLSLEFSNAMPFTVDLGIIQIPFTEDFNKVAILYNLLVLAVLLYFTYFKKQKKS